MKNSNFLLSRPSALRWLRAFLGVLVAVAIWLPFSAPAAEPLRVMSFNVRLPVDSDGPNRWEARRDLTVQMLAKEHPDLIGTQELHKRQGDALVAALPDYTWFGRDRHGGDSDEFMGVLYRKDRLRVLESGDFWLSDTPQVPGSITWGNLYPRMVTWARFQRISDGAKFTFFNTHLPYRDEDEPARKRGAELILSRVQALSSDEPLIVVGDFNTTSDSPTYAVLTSALTDAWTAATKREGPPSTFHNFTGDADRRIDWVLFRGMKAKSASTVTYSQGNRYPSDHFPVVVEFELKSN